MTQVLPRSANTYARLSLLAGGFLVAAVFTSLNRFARSPAQTGVGQPVPQPVAFSHAHHAGEEGIDCRYCHTSVERSAFAGIPPTALCLTCHSHILPNSPALSLVRQSAETGQPIAWNRVHDLPDFAYFDHSIHVRQGIGCETCHGRVDQMEVVHKAESLQMSWCLECHRQPERYVRPREAVFVMGWQPPESQASLGPRLVAEYGIEIETDCTVCHR